MQIEKPVLDVLSDKKSNGEERPWRENKIKSLDLSESYRRLNLENKFLRVHQCGNFLEFKKFGDDSKKLYNANFCKDRLCSMCAWRRELKVFNQVSKVIQYLSESNNYRFLFLTLTCKNTYGENLKEQLNLMFKSFDRLFKRKDVDKSIKGWFRALEITHDINKNITEEMYKNKKKYYDDIGLKIGNKNPNFDRYHPHFHVILMVSKSYFTDKDYYIKQEKWTSLWKESLGVDYTPIVDIRPFKINSNKSVSEVAKYTVKDNDYLVKLDKELTDRTVRTLYSSLLYRRLIAFGKLMKETHKKLNLSEIEDEANLIHIDEDGQVIEEVNYVIEQYRWNIGYSNYIKL